MPNLKPNNGIDGSIDGNREQGVHHTKPDVPNLKLIGIDGSTDGDGVCDDVKYEAQGSAS